MITYKRFLPPKLLFKGFAKNQIQDYLPGTDLLFCSSVRLGLLDLIDSWEIKSDEYILIPPICPQGIVLPMQKRDCNYQFYHLKDGFKVDISSIRKCISNKCKAVFFIHYFGIFNDQIYEIKKLCQALNVILIEDSVHGLFSKNENGIPLGSIGDISTYSLPKFLPVPDGAIFNINNKELLVKFNFRKSVVKNLMLFFHILSLLINHCRIKCRYKIVSPVLRFTSKLFYALYYYTLCSIQSNKSISHFSLRILSNINYHRFINDKQRIFKHYNKMFGLFGHETDNAVTTGYPIVDVSLDINTIKSELSKLGIESLSYIKAWNYIPDTIDFEYEKKLIYGHILLPLDSKVLNLDPYKIINIVKSHKDSK